VVTGDEDALETNQPAGRLSWHGPASRVTDDRAVPQASGEETARLHDVGWMRVFRHHRK
jgi:hypothetical protein